MLPELLLVGATVLFVGAHFAMSNLWRAALVARLGEPVFLATYSLVSLLLLTVMLVAYAMAPIDPLLWGRMQPVAMIAASLLTYVGLALLLASFANNPGLVGANLNGLSAVAPKGVFLITRHPMMFAVAFLALAHVLVAPTERNLVALPGMIVLAIYGAHLQDVKKNALHGREWKMWSSRTPFWPDLRQAGALQWAWFYAFLPWLAVTWLHLQLIGIPAGIWAMFPRAVV